MEPEKWNLKNGTLKSNNIRLRTLLGYNTAQKGYGAA